MIELYRPEECSGCAACVQACPRHCISLEADPEGFNYPKVEKGNCIHCGLCERVCPFQQTREHHPVVETYAAFSKDDKQRYESSSGGIYGTLCKEIIKQDGVVYGVRMSDDCRSAVFSRAANDEQILALQGSKYLQSIPVNIFNEIQRCLEKGRKVLFSGTPCQVNGLKLFLGKEYENLYTADIICHGVPSPELWRKYVDYLEKKYNSRMKSVNFRCKKRGWAEFGMEECFSSGKTLFLHKSRDPYMKMFLKNYCLRPSCYECKSKTFRLTDITLGDFWGINQAILGFNDEKGVSAVIIRTAKGSELFNRIRDRIDVVAVEYSDIISRNMPEHSSVKKPDERKEFFVDMNSYSFKNLIKKYTAETMLRKIYKKVSQVFRGII